MLSTATAAQHPMLDLHSDNWSQWHQALKQLCLTKFGVAGQQILYTIFLQPFPIEPTKADLEADLTGAPIPGLFTYQRRPATDAEADQINFNPAPPPPSPSAPSKIQAFEMNKRSSRQHSAGSPTRTQTAVVRIEVGR